MLNIEKLRTFRRTKNRFNEPHSAYIVMVDVVKREQSPGRMMKIPTINHKPNTNELWRESNTCTNMKMIYLVLVVFAPVSVLADRIRRNSNCF